MMSTTRLKEIHKQEQNQRKFVCVMNDLAKTQQEIYEGYLDKEKKEAVQRCQKSIIMTRRNVVRQRVLKKCMKTTREAAGPGPVTEKYGRYKGVCVEQIAENIDTYLEQDHPRVRRQRKLNRLFEKGYEKGEIIDYDTAKQRVHDYFETPLVQLHSVGKTSRASQRKDRTTYLPSLASGFYTGDAANDWTELGSSLKDIDTERDNNGPVWAHRKVSKFLVEDVPDNLSVQSDVAEASLSFNSTSKRRPITLPPIKVGTDNSTADGKPKTNCVAELISRLSRAKDKRERESRIRKEKRAKRLQAERVHGNPHTFSEPSVEEVTGHSLMVEGYGHNHGSDDGKTDVSRDTMKKLPPLKFKSSALKF